MDNISNFDLAVEELDSSYTVRVLESPFGEAEERVSRREVEEALEGPLADLLATVDRREGAPRHPSRESLEVLGERLFDLFFPRRIGELWRLSLGARGRSVLRLRLLLEKAPALARLPWEALSPGGAFIAQDGRISVVRYPTVPTPPRYGPAGWRVPKVLFVDACPPSTQRLDLDSEWLGLAAAFHARRGLWGARLERLSSASRPELSRSLDKPVRVVHFAGHGCCRAVFLHGADCDTESFSPHDWATALQGNRDLRLIVLNSCDGARARNDGASPSLAQALLNAGFLAVVAMQFPLSDKAALAFTRAFYPILAKGKSVDVAMSVARRELARTCPDEWASPTLYLRDDSGEIFPCRAKVVIDQARVMLKPVGRWIQERMLVSRHRLAALVGGSALMLVLVLCRATLLERWHRVERHASEPERDLLGSAPAPAAGVECPSPAITGIELVLIPAGQFAMGSERGEADEKPVHTVRITRPFCIGKTEITQRQWLAVMGFNPSAVKGGDLPVSGISWDEARQFVAKLNQLDPGHSYSLPSEAQWEYAAGAGEGLPYGFRGDPELVRYYGNCGGEGDEDGYSGPAPVEDFHPNRWGLFGMVGNVSEWVQDRHDFYSSAAASDPRGPEEGHRRVRRGGSFGTNRKHCRSTSRSSSEPHRRDGRFGLRIAAAPRPKT